jgi:FKBP-type peptidyl-prolyl cis-trans isomerase FklB
MRRAVVAATCAAFLVCQSGGQEKAQLKTKKDSLSYSLGVNIGKNFKQQSIDIDPNVLAGGIKDALSGGQTALTEEQVRSVVAALETELMAKQQEAMRALGEKNKRDGAVFLSENKKKTGVVTLPSGLQYKVLTKGTGKKPKATQTVTVNYRGTFLDGTEFDNSYTRGEPATFAVNGVIKGWTEALQLMPAGSKWQLYVPPELAYGEHGAGQVIPPQSTLIFEVELLSVK